MKRSFVFQIITLFLAVMTVLMLASCGKTERPAQKIAEEIAVDYGTYGEEAKDRIASLLKELKSADENAGVRFERIMDIWTSPELGKNLNYGVLPDGLPDTDELCIVVLGFQLEPDGSMKEELVQRLTAALESAKKYPNAYVVCTGGGTASENESATEAGKWLNG